MPLTKLLKPSIALLLSGIALVPTASPVHGANGTWTNLAGGSWTNPLCWNGGSLADGIGATADFTTLGLAADTTVTLDGNRTNGTLLLGDTLGAHNWVLSPGTGGTLTLAMSSGTPFISVTNQSATLGFGLAGSGGLIKSGAGTLVFTGTNTYTGTTSFTNGVVTFSGAGAHTGNNTFYLGGAAGKAVLNQNSTGTVSVGNSGHMYVGGTGGSSDSGQGVINQSSGVFNANAGTVNLHFGDGGTSYGAYNLVGGTLAITGTTQVGQGGAGVFTQSGGKMTATRYFALGSAANASGVVTFTGGTATIGTSGQASWDISIGDANSGSGMFNIGTEAGGSAAVTALAGSGLRVGSGGPSSAVVNFNSGSFQVAGPLRRFNTLASGIVNFNGATLKAGANITVLSNNLSGVYVYRGGAVLDSQTYTVTNGASLLAATGKGLYPSGGALNVSSGGSGYLAAPLVTVSGGSGSNITAIATVSGGSVVSVVLTCPGQNYVAGDVVNFAFSGGGATAPAPTFSYMLAASDLADNALGGLTKQGTGTLIVTAASTYQGGTVVSGGTLDVRVDGGLGSGNVNVANGASLILESGFANSYISSSASLVVASSGTVALSYSGLNTIQSLSLDGGATYATPGTWGAPGSAAVNQDAHFTGTGVLNVQSQPNIRVTLASSSNPSFYRQPITLTATAQASGATPTGTLTFVDGAVTLATVTLDGTGTATWTTNALTLGTHSLKAVYNGDRTYPAANSPVVAQVVNLGTDLWTGTASGVWDLGTSTNWSILGVGTPITYLNGDSVLFDDTASGSTSITLSAAVNPVTVLFSNSAKAYNLSGAGAIGGTTGLLKQGRGALTLNLANSYSGSTVVSNGILTYTGTASSSGNGTLLVGGGSGTAVLNMNSSGAVSFLGGTSVGGVIGNSADQGNGAIYQGAGSVSLGGGNLELGTGGNNTYGYYELDGGILTMASGSSIRVGAAGRGVFRQTAGTVLCSAYFAVASMSGGNASANSGAIGEATFTGGSLVVDSSHTLILGDKPYTVAVVNLGTLAGGSATITSQRNASGLGGIRFVDDTGATAGILNLNAGTLAIWGALNRSTLSFGTSSLNLNGATMQAATNLNFVDAGVGSGSYGGSARVYNGGVVFDTQSFTTTNAVDLQSPGGSGIYPAGGQFSVTANGGAGYIGAPQVTVSGGSGSDATAIAVLSGGAVAHVVMTCPGRNYQPGDVINFDFAGGGSPTPASTFSHTLQVSEVVANTLGTLTKIGNGTLLLSGNNSYVGPTVVNAGKLIINTANNGGGAYTVQNGSALTLSVLSQNAQMSMSALSMSGAATTLEFDFNPTAAMSWSVAPVNVAGAVAVSGVVTINCLNGGLSLGQYPLIQFASLSGAGSFQIGSLPLGVQAHLTTNTAAMPASIDLVITSSAQPRWDGQVNGVANGNWDIGTTQNWIEQLTQQATSYHEAQPVVFDDNAGGTTTINLATTVHPGSVTFNNSSRSYTIAGTGAISGGTGLLKQGSGTLILANANTFTNITTILNGTLQLGDGAASNGSVTSDINDNATLWIANPADQLLTNLIGGSGTLAKSANGRLTMITSNALTGQVAVNGGTLALNSGGTNGAIPVLGLVTNVTVGSGATLSLAGANTLGAASSVVQMGLSGGSLVTVGTGSQYVGTLNLASATVSGPGEIVVGKGLTTQADSAVTSGRLTLGAFNVLINGSTLTVGGDLSFPATSGSSVITADPMSGPGTLTTRGLVLANHYLELNYLTWNVDLGTNAMTLAGKLTIGRTNGLPATVNWISGTGYFTANDYFVLADGTGGGSGTLNVSGGSLTVSNNNNRCLIGNAGSAVIDVSGGSLLFLGSNTPVELGGDTSYAQNNASGTLTVERQGAVVVGPQSAGLRLGVNGGKTGVVGTLNLNGGTLTTWPSIVNGANSSGGTAYVNFNGGTLKTATNNANLLQGLTQATVQSGGAILDDGGYRVVLAQSLVGDGSGGGLTKLGAGTLVVSNAQSYTGATVVSNGTLEVEGSLDPNSAVEVWKGALAGAGTIGGSVHIHNGSALQPGSGLGAGTITIGGNLTLDANSSLSLGLGSSSSLVAVSGNLALGGTLNITNLSGFGAGTYTLFIYGGSRSGTVPVLGSLPAGFVGTIDTSTPGQVQLVVTALAANSPVFNSVTVADGKLLLHGTNGTPNRSYVVLSSTNVALPVGQWLPVSTNQFDATGAFSWTNTPDGSARRFFRLKLQ